MDGFTAGMEADRPPFTRACAAYDEDESFDCATVIASFADLPQEVRQARIARIEGRMLDRALFAQLISQPAPSHAKVGWSSRILRREESLLPHVGKILFCALIRLPGVQYTVEVDPLAKTVVHWEWQSV